MYLIRGGLVKDTYGRLKKHIPLISFLHSPVLCKTEPSSLSEVKLWTNETNVVSCIICWLCETLRERDTRHYIDYILLVTRD